MSTVLIVVIVIVVLVLAAAAVAIARRNVTVRCHSAWTSHSSGAGTIIASAVAFTAPTVSTTKAMSAGSRHVDRVAARTVSPVIQPTAWQQAAG